MRAFEYYQEAKPEHLGNPAEIEQLQSMFLQAGLAEYKSSLVGNLDSDDREVTEQDFILHLGDWFRAYVLTSTEQINGKDRKEYFLDLFDTDPEKAVSELNDLFMRSRH